MPPVVVPTGRPPTPPIAPKDHPVHGADPTLASWAHFDLDIGVTLNRGGGGFYDDRAHKYNPRYINPSSYVLRLDARTGLILNRRTQSAPLPAAAGGGGGGGEPTGPFVPKDLVAFSWTVVARHSGFHDRKIVQRPISPMEIAVFELPPRSDSYEVTLRVSFVDGRFAERTVQFDVRDWLIVSLGDSSASGQGNPDEIGSLGVGGGTVCDYPTLSHDPAALPRT